jgi:O-antigen ligase
MTGSALMRRAAREPALAPPPTTPPAGGPDAVTFLTVFIVLLFGIPTDRTITALGAIGSPAFLWAAVGGLWWCWHQLQRSTTATQRGGGPVRIAALVYLGAVAVSYAGAMFRGLPTGESSPADTGLVRAVVWVGLVLLVSDGIPNLDRLLVLVRRLVLAAALLALLGLLQFVTKQSLIDWFSLPGLSASDDASLQTRSGFARAPGTASHPLEYGFVLSTILPIALSLALWDTVRAPITRWLSVGLIALAAALAVSRSTLLGMAVGLALLLPTWSRRIQLAAVGSVALLVVGVYVAVPGMVGTIRGLFEGIGGSDSSASSRIGSYDLVAQFVAQNPVIGRGVGTFLPQYRILDNQVLQSAIEIGLLGVAALFALSITALVVTRFPRGGRSSGIELRVGHGLGAACAVGGVLLATFDVFSFAMATGVFFLVLGMAGAHFRLRGSAKPLD